MQVLRRLYVGHGEASKDACQPSADIDNEQEFSATSSTIFNFIVFFVMLRLIDGKMWNSFTFIQGIFIYGKVNVYSEQGYRPMLLFHFTDVILCVCMYYIQQFVDF